MARQYERWRKLRIIGLSGVGFAFLIAGWQSIGVSPFYEENISVRVAPVVASLGAAPAAAVVKSGQVRVAAAEHELTLPLAIRSGERYLVDAAGRPFLIHGDSAWSLVGELTRDEAEYYLEDRRHRGFNTLLVNLIEHRFSSRAPANAYGQRPFLIDGDFSTPNDDYFAHAEWIIRRAQEKGLIVLLAPAYLGVNGGVEGWYREMETSGPTKLKEYGRYLGRRFGKFQNIVWLHGGDYNPPNRNLVRSVVEGIREFDTDALNTVHGAPETDVLDFWAGEEWLRVSNVYTYGSVRRAALSQYGRSEGLPFFLLESGYENEHGASEHRIRVQAYQALLSGAAGQIFGNNPIWHFSGPGIFPAPVKWQDALGSRGAQSMSHLRNLFKTLPWWQFRPADNLLVSDTGYRDEQPVAARAADGSVAVIYLPTLRNVSVNLAELAGPQVDVGWFDPANGQFTAATDATLATGGIKRFRPPGRNSAELGDWILVLTSHP
jgi:hypothetical protein